MNVREQSVSVVVYRLAIGLFVISIIAWCSGFVVTVSHPALPIQGILMATLLLLIHLAKPFLFVAAITFLAAAILLVRHSFGASRKLWVSCGLALAGILLWSIVTLWWSAAGGAPLYGDIICFPTPGVGEDCQPAK